MGILSVVAQTAAIDCILGQDSPVTLQGQDTPLATVFQWADLASEPSPLRWSASFICATSPLPMLTLSPIIGFVFSFLSGIFPIVWPLFGYSC